jgi:hypothetical protein
MEVEERTSLGSLLALADQREWTGPGHDVASWLGLDLRASPFLLSCFCGLEFPLPETKNTIKYYYSFMGSWAEIEISLWARPVGDIRH